MNEKEKRTWHPSRLRFVRTHTRLQSTIFLFFLPLLLLLVLWFVSCCNFTHIDARCAYLPVNVWISMTEQRNMHIRTGCWSDNETKRMRHEAHLIVKWAIGVCLLQLHTRNCVARSPATSNETKRWSTRTNGRTNDHKQCYDELNKHFIFARDETCSSIPSIINACIDIWTSTATYLRWYRFTCRCCCKSTTLMIRTRAPERRITTKKVDILIALAVAAAAAAIQGMLQQFIDK